MHHVAKLNVTGVVGGGGGELLQMAIKLCRLPYFVPLT